MSFPLPRRRKSRSRPRPSGPAGGPPLWARPGGADLGPPRCERCAAPIPLSHAWVMASSIWLHCPRCFAWFELATEGAEG